MEADFRRLLEEECAGSEKGGGEQVEGGGAALVVDFRFREEEEGCFSEEEWGESSSSSTSSLILLFLRFRDLESWSAPLLIRPRDLMLEYPSIWRDITGLDGWVLLALLRGWRHSRCWIWSRSTASAVS
jgi:hypothetical protein